MLQLTSPVPTVWDHSTNHHSNKIVFGKVMTSCFEKSYGFNRILPLDSLHMEISTFYSQAETKQIKDFKLNLLQRRGLCLLNCQNAFEIFNSLSTNTMARSCNGSSPPIKWHTVAQSISVGQLEVQLHSVLNRTLLYKACQSTNSGTMYERETPSYWINSYEFGHNISVSTPRR